MKPLDQKMQRVLKKEKPELLPQLFLALACLGVWGIARADEDYERPPINYSKATTNNSISRLETKLATGDFRFSFHEDYGYLPALLKTLQVPESSQLLVFSKTSLQRRCISPKSPRALYFNDEITIGFCKDAEALEISAVDPILGNVFYTLDQQEAVLPKFRRETQACLLCHASSQTQNVPGLTLRSVYPDPKGEVIRSMENVRVDQTTPFDQRRGGWFVTGTHGKQKHRGNRIANNSDGQNITNLQTVFDTSAYLTPHSDLVALMVLLHQCEGQNLITRASIQTRIGLHNQSLLNKKLGRAAEHPTQGMEEPIRSMGGALVRYFLFSGEAKLTDKIKGTSTFAADFVKKGPRDAKGRSLRDFDLERRLFKYPCSFLIYSDAFEQMPTAMKNFVYQHMYDVLKGRHTGGEFNHLTSNDRQAILEILSDTKKDLPQYWRK